MNIQEYIEIVHNGNREWFTDEVSNYVNQKRILDVIRKREYLDGKHAILNRVVENYNGTPYEPRKVVLQYGKKVIELETTYLLKNPLTLTGQEEIVADFKKVYKKGKYNKIDFDILNHIVKYGNAYEYVFVNSKGIIQSKLIQPENGFPIYNDELEMIAFVEYYTSLESDFYVVYYEDRVEKYSTIGHGELRLISSHKNISGLPIHYKNDNEMDLMFGKSDLDDFINIIDAMEDILSKFSDSFYKHHNPIPVVIGQPLVGEGLNPHVVGGGINLDDGADFKMVSNELNQQAFETIYKTLKQELINISSTPAVSLNNADVSNLSETSMKILYQLADMKAGINEKYLREGLEQRFEKMTGLLSRLGKSYDEDAIDSLDVVFHYARPINETDVIDNIVKMHKMGAISIESILDIAPLITDSHRELERIKAQGMATVESVEEATEATDTDEQE
ncbi:phage portal protein [Niallia circulans]|uniref:phage portal protein n=1 Tax=Niallia circulans TaxID=1397 RepID=UPI002E215415|nr:phage portal protein [Niallia circulans]